MNSQVVSSLAVGGGQTVRSGIFAYTKHLKDQSLGLKMNIVQRARNDQ